MMFGEGGEFAYDRCARCQSIQIRDILDAATLSSFYPENYYSFQKDGHLSLKGKLRAFASIQRDRAAYRSNVVRSLTRLFPREPSVVSTLQAAGLKKNHRILDVGCGSGALLDRLAQLGFTSLAGVDPFVQQDLLTRHKVPIYKKRLDEVSETFDAILFNHSLEHVPSPKVDLNTVFKRLASKGRCIVRIPTPSSEAYNRYGVNWAQWDAPRHFTLISRQGVASLAQQIGFELEQTIDDSLGWSLMASELYKRGIALHNAKFENYFSPSEISDFKRKAAEANRNGRGDAAAFVLVKPR